MKRIASIASVCALTLVTGLVASAGSQSLASHEGSGLSQVIPMRFSGTSANGDFDEALGNALLDADLHFATVGADIRYAWILEDVSGQRGGFVFFNDLFVTISARAQR